MKKFMFSAVALVGFTVASYGANTVEVEVNENLTSENSSELTPYYCLSDWDKQIDVLMTHYQASFNEALVIANRNFDACLEDWLNENFG